MKSKNKNLPEYNFGSFQVFIQKALPDFIDIKKIFADIKKVIPEHLLDSLDIIYIGEFSFLKERGKLEDEFLLKRNRLKRALLDHGRDISKFNFYETEYNEEFDDLLHKEIGYDALRLIAVDIFSNPYAATSLREYFAGCFEDYYLNNDPFLKDLCPYVYKKLLLLNDIDNLEAF